MTRIGFAISWILLQGAGFIGWAATEQHRLSVGVGESILVRTEPVDPRDLLRGQFMRLQYPFSRGFGFRTAKHGNEVWVIMQRRRDTGEFHEPLSFHPSRPTSIPKDSVLLRGHAEGSQIHFGIEKLFVPEGTETPHWKDLTIRLRVGKDSRPRIEQAYVRGKPWP